MITDKNLLRLPFVALEAFLGVKNACLLTSLAALPWNYLLADQSDQKNSVLWMFERTLYILSWN